jgi:hypothetical protein
MIDLLKARPSVFAGVPRCLKSNLAMAFALLIIAIAVSRHTFRRAACLNLLQRSDNLRLRVAAFAHCFSPFLRPNRIPNWTNPGGQVNLERAEGIFGG